MTSTPGHLAGQRAFSSLHRIESTLDEIIKAATPEELEAALECLASCANNLDAICDTLAGNDEDVETCPRCGHRVWMDEEGDWNHVISAGVFQMGCIDRAVENG